MKYRPSDQFFAIKKSPYLAKSSETTISSQNTPQMANNFLQLTIYCFKKEECEGESRIIEDSVGQVRDSIALSR